MLTWAPLYVNNFSGDSEIADLEEALHVREQDACWHCGDTEALEVAHILELRDHIRFNDHREHGVIEHTVWDIEHVGNAILLCARCHRSFKHDPCSPSLAILPTLSTLELLLKHETADRRKRVRAGKNGIRLPRTLPELKGSARLCEPFYLTTFFIHGLPGRILTRQFPRMFFDSIQCLILKAAFANGTRVSSEGRKVRITGTEASRRLGIPEASSKALMSLLAAYCRPDPKVKERKTKKRPRGAESTGKSRKSEQAEERLTKKKKKAATSQPRKEQRGRADSGGKMRRWKPKDPLLSVRIGRLMILSSRSLERGRQATIDGSDVSRTGCDSRLRKSVVLR